MPRTSLPRSRRSAPASGFTLMEVLISIGVAAIGVLGVIALLPLGYNQALQGTLEDRKAVFGKQAFQDFRIRECGRPQRWIARSGNTWMKAASGGVPFPGAAYCFDPLGATHPGIVSQLSSVTPLIDPAGSDPGQVLAFPNNPTGAPNAPQMPRLALNVGLNPLSTINATAEPRMMQELVTVWDDLEFDLPADVTLPPVPMDATGGSWATVTPVRRQASGRFSWLATIVPHSADELSLYTVSIVVCHNRPLNYQVDDPTQVSHPERVVSCQLFGGGDVEFSSNVPSALQLRTGQWVMLSGMSGTLPVHKWYRIIQLDAPVLGAMQRGAVLHGPDWNGGANATATILEGVVAVYEKTLRLETSSAWLLD